MAVFYEVQEVAIACDHVPLQSGTAMVAVEASSDERVIYRFPYAEKQLPGRAPGGMIPASRNGCRLRPLTWAANWSLPSRACCSGAGSPFSFRAWMIRAGGSSQRMPGCGTRATGLDSRCPRASRVGPGTKTADNRPAASACPAPCLPRPARQANTQMNMCSHPEDAQTGGSVHDLPDGKRVVGARQRSPVIGDVAVALLTRTEAQGHSIRSR